MLHSIPQYASCKLQNLAYAKNEVPFPLKVICQYYKLLNKIAGYRQQTNYF